MRVNMHEAKTNLSRLVAALESGEEEEIEIARAGRAVARLILPGPATPRRPGRLAGKIKVADDFDAPLPKDVAEAFEGHRP